MVTGEAQEVLLWGQEEWRGCPKHTFFWNLGSKWT